LQACVSVRSCLRQQDCWMEKKRDSLACSKCIQKNVSWCKFAWRQIITDENGIYSSGGAYSSLNLILYLVEKYAGRETAVFCSKAFQIDIQRDSQSPFTIFIGQKEHEDEPIKKAQEFIEHNFQNKISVDQLAPCSHWAEEILNADSKSNRKYSYWIYTESEDRSSQEKFESARMNIMKLCMKWVIMTLKHSNDL